MDGIDVRVLGPLSVRRDGVELALGGALPRRLVLVLVAAQGRSVSSARLLDEVWEERLPDQARASLAVYVSRLRATLAQDGAAGRDLLRRDASGYALLLPPEAVDAHRLTASLSRAGRELEQGDAAAAYATALQGLGLWRGGLVVDELPASARPLAVRSREERLALEEVRARAALALGRHAEVIPLLEALLDDEPLREQLAQLLSIALHRAGRQPEALAVVRSVGHRLAEQYGLEPRPELRELERALLAQDPALDPPAATSAVPVSGQGGQQVRDVPVPLTRLVGRDELVVQVARHLAASRLVTLVGTGGGGKTRVAIEAARAGVPGHVAVWLPLARWDDGQLLDHALAEALSLHAPGAEVPRAGARRVLRVRPHLLVVDNAEHLLTGVRSLLADLLASDARLRVLVTSRVPLELPGEVLVDVPPLPVDAGDAPGPAVQLFLERARAASPGWEPDAEDLQAVARLCRALDGIPLALELAAARTRALTPGDIALGLQRGEPLLVSGGSGALTPHHESLASAVEWSDRLLSRADQALFRALATFHGSFDLGAAAAVSGQPVQAGLSRLVSASLVVVEHGSGPRRYRLLQVLREWARAQTLPEHARALAAAHAAWAASLARAAAPHLRSAGSAPEWFERLDREAPDLLAALRSSLAAGDPLLALQTAADLHLWWVRSGRLEEGAEVLQEALRAPSDEEDRARALLALLDVRWMSGATAAARAAAEEAEQLTRTGDDSVVGAVVLARLANMLVADGDLARARTTATTALGRARALRGHGRGWAEADALLTLGSLAAASGEPHQALELLEASRTAAEPEQDWPLMVGGAWLSGKLALRSAQPARAARDASRAAVLAARLGLDNGMLVHVQVLAAALAEVGQPDLAASLLGGVDAHARRLGWSPEAIDPQDAPWLTGRVRAALPPQAWDDAYARGAGWARDGLLAAVERARRTAEQ